MGRECPGNSAEFRRSADGARSRKRIPLELPNYLGKAVLTPKALYAVIVARPPDEEICALEQWAWRKFNHPSFPRALSRLAPEALQGRQTTRLKHYPLIGCFPFNKGRLVRAAGAAPQRPGERRRVWFRWIACTTSTSTTTAHCR
jgi:hypothetical protein